MKGVIVAEFLQRGSCPHFKQRTIGELHKELHV
jgi:hypothetical protein